MTTKQIEKDEAARAMLRALRMFLRPTDGLSDTEIGRRLGVGWILEVRKARAAIALAE
jgi:hypothetical protein